MTRGTKRRRTIVEEELPPEQPEELPGGLFDAADDLLDRAAEELGAGLAHIRIYVVGKGGAAEYLTQFPADEHDTIIEDVARRYGGGQYLARFYSDAGKLDRAPVKFKIAAQVKPADDDDAPLASGGTRDQQLLDKLLMKMIDGGGGATNPAAITAAIIQSATAQAAAMTGAVMPMMQKMMEMSKPQQLPAETLAEMFTAGLEFSKGGDSSSPLALVERFAGIIEKAMGGARARAVTPLANPAAPVVASPEGEPVAQLVSPTPKGAENVPGWMKMLRPYLADLQQAAQDQTPASLVAAVIADRSPAVADWLAGQEPTTFTEAILQHVPELVPHREWLIEVLGALAESDGVTDGADEPTGPKERNA